MATMLLKIFDRSKDGRFEDKIITYPRMQCNVRKFEIPAREFVYLSRDLLKKQKTRPAGDK